MLAYNSGMDRAIAPGHPRNDFGHKKIGGRGPENLLLFAAALA